MFIGMCLVLAPPLIADLELNSRQMFVEYWRTYAAGSIAVIVGYWILTIGWRK